jgi:hypothetical protein
MFQILVSTCVQLISSQSVLSHGPREENASPLGSQRETRANNGNGNFTCTTEGRFPNPENCSEYYLCVLISPGNMYFSEMTCPNALVFNPNTQKCTTTDKYSCTPPVSPTVCEAPGIVCHNVTTFTWCADVNVPIVTYQPCPQGYFCNENCSFPCLNSVSSC